MGPKDLPLGLAAIFQTTLEPLQLNPPQRFIFFSFPQKLWISMWMNWGKVPPGRVTSRLESDRSFFVHVSNCLFLLELNLFSVTCCGLEEKRVCTAVPTVASVYKYPCLPAGIRAEGAS